MGAKPRNGAHKRTKTTGTSFWETDEDEETLELTTDNELVVDDGATSWTVRPVKGIGGGKAIASTSPEVRRFLATVRGEMVRVTKLQTARPPVPKPAPKSAAAAPRNAPLPCPLCRPSVGGVIPAEPWPDCELCDGWGVVSAEEAEAWREEHG